MSGVRVSLLPLDVTQKDIKIHFANPEHGGGAIKNIYHPLFHGDAVVLFEDDHTAETVLANQHNISRKSVWVNGLPTLQVFPILEAQVDSSVTQFLQATEEARDEIQHHGNLEYHYSNETNVGNIRGNWYQLEWAWNYFDRIMREQKRFQNYVAVGHSSKPGDTRDIQLTKGRLPVRGDDESIISMPSHWSSFHNEKEQRETKKDNSSMDDNEKQMKKRDEIEPEGEESDEDPKGGRNTQSTHSSKTSNNANTKSEQGHNSESSKSKYTDDTVIINNDPEDVRNLDFHHGRLLVSIYTGEITMEETEAIVNAAMGTMINGGGVAFAIARAASPEMQKQCDDYVRRCGSLDTAGVTHTCAGGRISPNVKYILHAVGPIWSSAIGEHTCGHLLTKTFLNCMLYGNEKLKLKSIAMPVISSGIFGCPLDICIKSFLDAIILFTSQKHGDGNLYLQEVHLVNNNDDNTALTVILLRQLIEDGLAKRTIETVEQFNKMSKQDKNTRKKVSDFTTTEHVDNPGAGKPTKVEPPVDRISGTNTKDLVPKTEGRPLPPIPMDSKSEKQRGSKVKK